MTFEKNWDQSYQNKDNFLFYPHEEIIRFVSSFIKKRTGINEFKNIYSSNSPAKVLDVGCGIGRHVKFLNEYGIDAYGFDFSAQAIEVACELTSQPEKLKVASVESIPFENGFFNFALSHGVFDSMPFSVAKNGMNEVHRCLSNDGLFYLDLISGDCSAHYAEYNQEEVVQSSHEQGTIQSYFNWSKIEMLIQGKWEILEACKVVRESVSSSGYHSRYHIILKKI